MPPQVGIMGFFDEEGPGSHGNNCSGSGVIGDPHPGRESNCQYFPLEFELVQVPYQVLGALGGMGDFVQRA